MKVLSLSVTERGKALAERLPWEHHHGRAAETIRGRWEHVDALVLFLATGAAVRIIAPLLSDKHRDPAVVCVDEAGRYAVALSGGHGGGANDLARTVAEHLGAEAVITTATDAVGCAGLDQLPGFTATGDTAALTAALLDGRAVRIDNPRGWPLPPGWPGPPGGEVAAGRAESPGGEVPAGSVSRSGREVPAGRAEPPGGEVPAGRAEPPGGEVASRAGPSGLPIPLGGDRPRLVTMIVTDRRLPTATGQALLHPPSLVLGIGTSTDAPPGDVAELVDEALEDAGLSAQSVAEVATIDRRVSEPAVVALGYPIRVFTAAQLAAVDVPTPSATVEAAVGTPSVCEAAALLAAGPGAELVVTKRTCSTATVAIARRLGPRGYLSLVGLGPGKAEHRTPAAERAVRRAQVVIGYRAYLELCADLVGPGQRLVASPIGDEVVRAKQALAEADAGLTVALVCSGDAGIYAMASIVLELSDGSVDIEVVPGITAASASAALLGAPLGHDHASISLSDLLTDWDTIERRLRAAADADLVVSVYNPRSRGRTWQLEAARRILLERRPPTTPVGIVTDAGRTGQVATLTTLADLDPELVGMTTCVIIGASTTKVVSGRMVTPRGYR